jgi:cell division protein FtsL
MENEEVRTLDNKKETVLEVPVQEQLIRKIVKNELKLFKKFELILLILISISVVVTIYNQYNHAQMILKEKVLIEQLEIRIQDFK